MHVFFIYIHTYFVHILLEFGFIYIYRYMCNVPIINCTFFQGCARVMYLYCVPKGVPGGGFD